MRSYKLKQVCRQLQLLVLQGSPLTTYSCLACYLDAAFGPFQYAPSLMSFVNDSASTRANMSRVSVVVRRVNYTHAACFGGFAAASPAAPPAEVG